MAFLDDEMAQQSKHSQCFLSAAGSYGEIPFSELAMHVRAAGKACTRYLLIADRRPEFSDRVSYAYVEFGDSFTHGLPGEVLPSDVRRKLGYGTERMPSTTETYGHWSSPWYHGIVGGSR